MRVIFPSHVPSTTIGSPSFDERVDEREHAAEARLVRGAGARAAGVGVERVERGEERGVVLRVRGALAREARGAHAGRAAERVDLEAGVVGEREHHRRAGDRLRPSSSRCPRTCRRPRRRRSSRFVTSWTERTCTPSPPSRARSSSSLPRFCVATTSECVIGVASGGHEQRGEVDARAGEHLLLDVRELLDADEREVHHADDVLARGSARPRRCPAPR